MMIVLNKRERLCEKWGNLKENRCYKESDRWTSRKWQVNILGTHNAKINLGEFKTYRDVKEKKCRGKQQVAYLTSRMEQVSQREKPEAVEGYDLEKEWEKNTESERETFHCCVWFRDFVFSFDICCLSDKIGSIDFFLSKAKFIYSFQMSRKPGTKKWLKKIFMNFLYLG